MMSIDRKKFFDSVRESLFNGLMSQGQVHGMEECLREYERRGMTDLKQLAYILGTIYHEVARTMQPIEERGKGKGRRYGKKVRYNGKPYSTPDVIYYGRGHTQNTWIDIYEKLRDANTKGWDFVNHPELLLQMEPSIWATFHSMITGLYTGKKLSDYFTDTKEDWKNARRIINGTDKADLIADYAKKFYTALI